MAQRVRSQFSVSIDGYGAGPDQSPDDPLGIGGERLHEWALQTEGWRKQHGYEGGERNIDSDVAATHMDGIGAVVMGRGMFGGGPGDWDPDWKGWWGEDPPFHTPTFVLTHHEREPLEMDGGTTFHFVTDGLPSAVDLAREAAGSEDVLVAGGPSTINQCLAAGLLDELFLHVVPVVLGGGERLLTDVGDPSMRPVEVIASPAVTHIRYEIS